MNSFFGIATMVISIPTGAKIFNWLFTMYRGDIRFELPMMWVVAFMLTFVVGGMTGVLLAIPPADFVLHNSLFLVAHFHNVIIGGVVFGLFAAMVYWFPKAFGFKLDPFWGKVAFWGWVAGYWIAWTPIYVVGLMGTVAPRAPFRRPEPPALLRGCGLRRAGHPGRHPGLRDEHRRGLPEASRAARHDGRSLGRQDARMVDLLAAASLQLRLHCPSSTTSTPGTT